MRVEHTSSNLRKSCLKDILSLPESYWVTSKLRNSSELKAFQKLWKRTSDTKKRDISGLRLAVHDAPTSNDWLVHEVPLTKIRGNLKDKKDGYTFFFWSFVLYISSRWKTTFKYPWNRTFFFQNFCWLPFSFLQISLILHWKTNANFTQ